jgi:3-hydroxyisobutyrate dehydrogenase
MATVGIEATDRLLGAADEAGVAFVDAPVSGTKQPAEQGKLTVLASGAHHLRARCEPVFEAVAAKVLWVGEAGDGSRLKLVVNAWLAALVAGLAEAIALAERIGVDPRLFLATIEGGPLGSGYAAVKGPMMIERDYQAAFPLDLLAKDVDLVADAARQAGLPLRLPEAIRALLSAASEVHGEDDMAAIIEALRR